MLEIQLLNLVLHCMKTIIESLWLKVGGVRLYHTLRIFVMEETSVFHLIVV